MRCTADHLCSPANWLPAHPSPGLQGSCCRVLQSYSPLSTRSLGNGAHNSHWILSSRSLAPGLCCTLQTSLCSWRLHSIWTGERWTEVIPWAWSVTDFCLFWLCLLELDTQCISITPAEAWNFKEIQYFLSFTQRDPFLLSFVLCVKMALYPANADARSKGPYLHWEDTAGAETGPPQTSNEIE